MKAFFTVLLLSFALTASTQNLLPVCTDVDPPNISCPTRAATQPIVVQLINTNDLASIYTYEILDAGNNVLVTDATAPNQVVNNFFDTIPCGQSYSIRITTSSVQVLTNLQIDTNNVDVINVNDVANNQVIPFSLPSCGGSGGSFGGSAAAGTCALVVNNIAATATDDCTANPAISYTLSGATTGSGNGDPSGSSFNVGTTNIRYIATDDAGKKDTCDIDVVVTDDERPTISCPIGPGGQENIRVQMVNLSGGMDTFKYELFDVANSLLACDTLFTTVESFSTLLDCATTGYSVRITNLTGTDVLTNLQVRRENNDELINENDVSSGASFSFDLPDCNDIIVALPPNVCDSAVVNGITPTFMDNCPSPSLSYTFSGASSGNGTGDASGQFFKTGTTTLVYSASDGTNTSACSFDIVVRDTNPPTAECQDVTVYLDAMGMALIDSSLVDNGSSVSCSSMSNLTLSLDTAKVDCSDITSDPNSKGKAIKLFIEDEFGNVDSCDANAAVFDSTAPVAICQNVTLDLSQNGINIFDLPLVLDNGSTDNCGIDTLFASMDTFRCQDLDTNYILLTVLDASGNQDTCSDLVFVQDLIDPVAVCQDITVSLDNNGMAIIAANELDGGSTDNCGIDSFAVDKDTFECSDIGDNIVMLTVFDQSGYNASCPATVTVTDTMPPEFTFCPPNIELLFNEPTDTMALGFAEATDNCMLDSIAFRDDSTGFINGSPLGVITRTFIAVDTAGNVDSCSQDITLTGKAIQLSVLLSGPLGLTSGLQPPVMWDSLRTKGLIPLTSPYGTGEVISDSATVLTEKGDISIVDWVLIELRNRTDASQVVTARSALVQRNGEVVDTNGVAAILFDEAELMGQDSFFVAIRHRNHLGAMTAELFSLEGATVDFTDPSGSFFNAAPIAIGGVPQDSINWLDKFALWPGNANQDAQVDRDDEQTIIRTKVTSDTDNTFMLLNYIRMGYCPEDVNMDGSVIYTGQRNDIDVLMDAIYRHPQNGAQDPGFVIIEQLPLSP